MKKKNILIFVFLFASIGAIAQNNVENKKKLAIEDSTKISDADYDSTMLSNPISYESSSFSGFSPDYITNPYYTSVLNTPLNWSLNDTTPQSRFLFTPFNQEVRYFGLGGYNNRGASLMWTPTNKLSLKVSAFLSRQYGFILSSRQMAYGANFELNYNLTNILKFRLWGQYVTPANQDPFINASDLFPKTNAGAALIVEPKDNLEFGVGVEYQYNQKEQNWKPKTGGRISVGF